MTKMTKKLNEYVKWILVALAFCGIIWNAATLHFGVKQNNAVLQNEMIHFTADMAEIKVDIKAINQYLLLERKDK